MKYDWMDAYVLKKRGVTKDFQPAWNWIRYHVGKCLRPSVWIRKRILITLP